MTQQTIIAHFDSRSDARQAVQALTQVGIGQSERRPAHGPLLTGDENLFQERTIEAEERVEEAVVSKQARVKEELVIRKDVEDRTEVDIEDERGTKDVQTGTTGSTTRDRGWSDPKGRPGPPRAPASRKRHAGPVVGGRASSPREVRRHRGGRCGSRFAEGHSLFGPSLAGECL
jgi:hypothetical protein